MDLADRPTKEEEIEAIGKLKGGKAGGRNGILPEMVKSCGGETMDYIVELFDTMERTDNTGRMERCLARDYS